MEGKINNKFEILLELNLVRKNGSDASEKIKGLQIPLYKYSKSGILLALIIKSMNLRDVIAITKKEDTIAEYKKELDKIHGDIYEVFHFVYKIKNNSPAPDIFYSIFIQKCREKGIFDRLVHRIYLLLNWDYGIESFPGLLYRAIYKPPFFDKETQTDFTDVFHQAIEGLDQESQKLILYEIKIFAENKFERKLQEQTNLTRPYEEFRFKLRSDYERIAVEGYCEHCKGNQTVALHYLDLKLSPENEKSVDCPNCNTKGSLLVSSF
jgi:hypothetical protein